MKKESSLQLFEHKQVRTHWDEEQEKWYFSVVDVIAILTDQSTHQGARNYWKVLKNRLIKEGNETVTNCNRLKLLAEDGKMRFTDVADTEQLFRLRCRRHHTFIATIERIFFDPFRVEDFTNYHLSTNLLSLWDMKNK